MIVFLTLVSVLIFLPRKKLRFSLLAAASLVVVIAYQTILLPDWASNKPLEPRRSEFL